MATPEEFRRIALAFPGASEGAHMGHADFRVGGRIFATLGNPDAGWGMAGLLPEQQENYTAMAPETFVPAPGAWGRGGSTRIRLAAIDAELLEAVLSAAWAKRAAKPKRARTHP